MGCAASQQLRKELAVERERWEKDVALMAQGALLVAAQQKERELLLLQNERADKGK